MLVLIVGPDVTTLHNGFMLLRGRIPHFMIEGNKRRPYKKFTQIARRGFFLRQEFVLSP